MVDVVKTEASEEDTIAFDSVEIEQLPCDHIITADFVESSLADLEVEISKKTGIPVEKLALLHR